MKVLTDQNNLVIAIAETITQEPNGLFDGEVIYAMPGLTINDVATIPSGVVPVQYCYDSTNGFTKNPNYVEPFDPQTAYNNLSAVVNQLMLTIAGA